MGKFLCIVLCFAVVAGIADARLGDRIRERRAERHERKASAIRGRMGAGACGSAPSSSMTVTYSRQATATVGSCANGMCAVPQTFVAPTPAPAPAAVPEKIAPPAKTAPRQSEVIDLGNGWNRISCTEETEAGDESPVTFRGRWGAVGAGDREADGHGAVRAGEVHAGSRSDDDGQR